MTNVMDVIAHERRWLRISRDELIARLRHANQLALWRWQDGRAQLRGVVADLSHLVDRSIEPVFDAALAVAEVAHDIRAIYRRALRIER